ncbi:MAG: 50S ribosomal protein L23 [Candidatus Saccharimonadales bacterium]
MSKLLLLPIVSEKAMELSENANVYMFEVPLNTTKIEVARAVANEFKVNVKNVNVAVRHGKVKTQRTRGGRQSLPGRRSDKKLAYVTLKEGDSIKLFEGDENA